MFKPKLKGFMVGNAVTNWKYDTTPAYIDIGYWRGLYDTTTWEALKANDCPRQFEYFEFKYKDISYDCKSLVDRFDLLTKDINVYDIYGKCYKPEDFHKLKAEDMYETVEVNG